MTEKKIEVQFAPGCFDAFDGSQDELNELMAEIQRLAQSGELLEDGHILDVEEMSDTEYAIMQNAIESASRRTLQ